MPSLIKLLQSYDNDMLARIAHAWELDIEAMTREKIEEALVDSMTNEMLLQEMINVLPPQASKAWETLAKNVGRLPWSEFSRKFGDLRNLGPAARERAEPDLHPDNAVESLYYRGLIGRGFLDAHPEPREFAFIPEEILSNPIELPATPSLTEVRPVTPSEIKRHQSANTRLLDHVTDWLSCLRMNRNLNESYFTKAELTEKFIAAIAVNTGLISQGKELQTDLVGSFLQAERLSKLKEWFTIWKKSGVINDLLMMPGYSFEGTWSNDPIFSRNFILQKLTGFDVQTWYSLSSFIAMIKTESPDFQRPAGNFDTLSIRKTGSKVYLAGREHWDDVEGEFIRYLFKGPLHWLGVVDLAYSSMEVEPYAFRLSTLANYLLKEEAQKPILAAETTPKLSSDLTIIVPVNASRLLRYQIGRFTGISSNSISETRFQITAESLTIAENFGLKIDQLLRLLAKHIKSPQPQSFKKLAQRWDQNRLEARFEKTTLLRVEDPSILKQLMEHPNASRMIKEVLTPQFAIINSKSMQSIQKILLESGILSQTELDV